MPTSCSSPVTKDPFLRQHYSMTPASFAGKSGEQAGPDISRLAPHLQQEWDHAANAHLGSITLAPQSGRMAWWRSGMCKTGHPHRWLARVAHRSRGSGCCYKAGHAICPCNNLAENYPAVAAEWDWDTNGEKTPEVVGAGSRLRAAWRCGLCGHRWSALVAMRTQRGSGCPQCGREASRKKAVHPSISVGAPHLLAEWDWEVNLTAGWHPDEVTLGSVSEVHWVVQDECKLGLVHRWQAPPQRRVRGNTGSPFPSGQAVCACNSLAVQCPKAADLWDHQANGGMTPENTTVLSAKTAWWKAPDGRQWQQRVGRLVYIVRRHEANSNR